MGGTVTFSRGRRRSDMSALIRMLPLLASLLASAAQAGSPVTATRTDRFSAPGPVRALVLSTISGQVRVTAGATFAASVEVVAHGTDKAAAEAALARARINFAFDGGKVSLRTELSAGDHRRDDVETNYTITTPAGTAVSAHTVDGTVKLEGLSGPLSVDTVNGAVDIAGTSPELRIRTVNGKVQAHLATPPAGARISAETVSGEATLWFPAGAPLRLSAQTLSGQLLSTFAFPPSNVGGGRFMVERRYEGELGSGGASVRLRSVSGRLAVCAAGTSLEAARPLVSAARSFEWTGLRGPRARGGRHGDGDVKLDKVVGDFEFDSSSGDVKVESVSGRVKLRTQSGDVHLGSVGGAADIETGGGDIRLKSVVGDLRVRSGGGDLRIDSAGGNAHLETQGGDIRLDVGRGSITASTRGGDVSLQHAQGSVHAETDGGDVTVAVTGRPSGARPEIYIATRGGDVNLTLPANLAADVDVEVTDADDEARIASEFPQVTVKRGGHTQTATGKLGAGGAPVKIRARSGKVTIRRGPSL
jgi:DUF4097 and DUF4098 domain-containing protein YvlB